jgi:hypothetical protein
LKSSYLTPEQVHAAHLTPIESVEDTVSAVLQKAGSGADICVLPEGPQTIPYVA